MAYAILDSYSQSLQTEQAPTISSSPSQYSPSVYEQLTEKLPSPREILSPSAPSFLLTPLPTVATLTALLSSVEQPSYDPAGQVVWCRDVLSLAERLGSPLTTHSNGPLQINDPTLRRLLDVALPMLLRLSTRRKPMQSFVPGYVAEALYLCAMCEARGSFPHHIALNPKLAFTHFEAAAKAGFHSAYYNLGTDFEQFGDVKHALQCFERGAENGAPNCLYHLGLAHLTGQLGLPEAPDTALPLLKQAAVLATVDVPEPAYLYALLLLQEFESVFVGPALLDPLIPRGSTPEREARTHLKRAAYLNHAPAQARLGRAYELADAGCAFDPVLSVQYYALASAQGELEADMALSKWFLCGSEDAFAKDEVLAYEYAERAARRGLASAQFAMGYYTEVGIGCAKDVATARKWYTPAAQQGNTDASDRLKALSRSQSLSRKEHEKLTDTQLVRKRTQARMRSQAAAAPPMPPLPPSPSVASFANTSGVPPPMNAQASVAPLNFRKAAAPQGPPRAPAMGSGPPPSANAQYRGPPSRDASPARAAPYQYQSTPSNAPSSGPQMRINTPPGGLGHGPHPNAGPGADHNGRPPNSYPGSGPNPYGGPGPNPYAGPGPNPSARPNPNARLGQNSDARPGPNSNAYSGPNSGARPSPGSNGHAAQRREPQGPSDRAMTPPQMPMTAMPTYKGPRTFQEMGVSVQKQEDGEKCVVM
ncbi:predicted protein [Postia placenta Mad-698-R]|uniref:HCP-like protein n=1 Tax=Postia placenta MAD-698-R-SB12 TaxID=670580 RepID=A0A1X6MKL9_9APHY|nr:hypothetical protein POSPLADRAFT_1158541 [Postia placenta MAD-698-R-SB12]EED81353.1 predicted protein [Postia placenta Mad-698-R]OSX56858.1 hypothetical protein POSPLADRAFT_1158541 [Postia placenta MAD-698-R-SB12]